MNVATNFEKARGWVRKNWKTKHYNHENVTFEEFIQISSSDEDIANIGEKDDASRSFSEASPLKFKENKSLEPLTNNNMS